MKAQCSYDGENCIMLQALEIPCAVCPVCNRIMEMIEGIEDETDEIIP